MEPSIVLTYRQKDIDDIYIGPLGLFGFRNSGVRRLVVGMIVLVILFWVVLLMSNHDGSYSWLFVLLAVGFLYAFGYLVYTLRGINDR